MSNTCTIYITLIHSILSRACSSSMLCYFNGMKYSSWQKKELKKETTRHQLLSCQFRAIINILIVLQFVQNLSFDIRTFWRPCERFVWYVSNIGLMNIICHFVNYHLSIVSLIILFISLSSSIGLTFVWYLFHIVRYKLLSHIYFLPI